MEAAIEGLLVCLTPPSSVLCRKSSESLFVFGLKVISLISSSSMLDVDSDRAILKFSFVFLFLLARSTPMSVLI